MIKRDSNLELAVSQLIGIGAAIVTDGDYTKAAELAKNSIAYNRQLHPSEREMAKWLAELSDGKYTQEQIEEQLRLAGIKGTDIHVATDILVTAGGIYDDGGNWVPAGEEHYTQLFGSADPEVIAFIKSGVPDIYSWTPDAETGFSRYLGQEWDGIVNTGERDRLTGYALDEQGGYRVPMVVEGVAYTPRFHPCGDAECLAVGANIDFSDPATLGWIRSVDAKTADQVSKMLAAAAVVAPAGAVVGLSNSASVAGLLSGFLKEDFHSGLTPLVVSSAFASYAESRGLTKVEAARITNFLGVSEVWDKLADKL